MSQKTLRRPPTGQQIANHTIFTGDNLDIMRGMDDNSIDLIYHAPPFNSNRRYEAPIGSEAAGAGFKDAWTLDDTDNAWLGLIADQNPALYEIIRAVGFVGSKGDKAYLIYMAMRLLEMQRILKPSGSIYLHCDDAMSHSLKLVMDAIFGTKALRNEIVWKRNSAHNDSKSFGRVMDKIFFYGHQINKDAVREPLNEEYVKNFYRHKDKRGTYRADNLSAKGLSGGGYDYNFHGHNGPWRYPEKRMLELEKQDRIHFPKKKLGVPAYKRYLHENKGQVPSCIWADIPPVQGRARERTGYPTQKPLALLKRIIAASSNEGDIVLDPFCGCATACIAAEDLGRRWVGIDISPKAAELVRTRAERELTDFFKGTGKIFEVVHRVDIPIRSKDAVRSRDIKHELFGKQEGQCNGCGDAFSFRNFEVDHIVPTSKGGPNVDENLQLLCGHCNRVKGDRDMPYLIARLKADGIITDARRR